MKRLWVTIIVFLLLMAIGAGVFVRWQKRKVLAEIGLEIGSIAELRHPYVVPNRAGTRLLINMDAEDGPGVNLYDVATGNLKLLYTEPQKGYTWVHYKLLGWSPGDEYLAYGRQIRPKSDPSDRGVPGDLVIADGVSGETLHNIRVSPNMTNAMYRFTWLSSNSFAFLNIQQDLFWFERSSNAWLQTSCFTNITGGNQWEAQSLATLSPTKVSWRVKGCIWDFDLVTGEKTKSWENDTNTLVTSWYSPAKSNYLLVCSNITDGQSLWEFDPQKKSAEKLSTFPWTQDSQAPPVWVNIQSGYAFLKAEGEKPEDAMFSLFVATNATAQPIQVLRSGEVRLYSHAQERLFIAGTLTNEPPGIWEFNSTNGSLRSILTTTTRGRSHVEFTDFEQAWITNAHGRVFSYHIWRPAHFDPKIKYPLVLGNSHYSWTPFPLASANCGYWYAAVDRLSWDAPVDDWSEEVMLAYTQLARHPNVDTNRVYLSARSVESAPATELYTRCAKYWKGMIYFDPSVLPQLTKENAGGRILIVCGEFEDAAGMKQINDLREEARRFDVTVNIEILKGARHTSYGIAPQRQRVFALVDFLSEL